ncbi:MAG: hypothetical protein J6V09_04610, partial [Clostridia bacterium]|nr:hypothetical protein [Clostridia bacterium]
LKPSLSVQFISATAVRRGLEFVITMSPFFATRLSSNEPDMRILKGVVAEIEKVNPADLSIKIVSTDRAQNASTDELDDILN